MCDFLGENIYTESCICSLICIIFFKKYANSLLRFFLLVYCVFFYISSKSEIGKRSLSGRCDPSFAL